MKAIGPLLLPFLALVLTLGNLTGCRRGSEVGEEQTPTAAARVAASDPLADWQPRFDPRGAEYTYLLSNVDHPSIEGIAVGYHIRDKVWELSDGRLYVDFRPMAQLGGERDVITKLRLGAVQGMLCSSVAAVNVADKLGVVNLPFVIDSFDKLQAFRNTPELFDEFRDAAAGQGILALDFTNYGAYGWATREPVRTLEEARRVHFRVAQAPVNIDSYRAWGLRFTVMPWPDVPQALQTGVVTGLDHTFIVCAITNKFNVARNFTPINYAQGLYIHLINKEWLSGLPQDLQEILVTTIEQESARARARGVAQEQRELARAVEQGLRIHELDPVDRQRLIELSEPVYAGWRDKIGADYLQRVQETLADL